MASVKKMSEAEVSLRLAFHLLDSNVVASDVQVAIDGAQLKTGPTTHFAIRPFLSRAGFTRTESSSGWQGIYRRAGSTFGVVVHSNPGQGDVVACLKNGRILRVESKKGPLGRSKSSPEYRLLREALGQLLTVENVGSNDVLAVAVPESPKFRDLIDRWRRAPLVRQIGVHLLTVDTDGRVRGLEETAT